jgi:RNA polymerase sigma-70 factor (ECF subfamily)
MNKLHSSAKVFELSRVNSMERMDAAHTARLISQCLAGDAYAIETLVREYEVGVFRLALSIVGDQADANEITQETFISALRSLSSYQEKKSFKAWLYTIALNHSRSVLRKRKSLVQLGTILTSIFRVEIQKQVYPEDAVIQNEKEAVLWNSLNQLDERFRTVVVLRYFHELSIAEISEILSISEGTIHSRLHSAREKLRDALEGVDGEERKNANHT